MEECFQHSAFVLLYFQYVSSIENKYFFELLIISLVLFAGRNRIMKYKIELIFCHKNKCHDYEEDNRKTQENITEADSPNNQMECKA